MLFGYQLKLSNRFDSLGCNIVDYIVWFSNTELATYLDIPHYSSYCSISFIIYYTYILNNNYMLMRDFFFFGQLLFWYQGNSVLIKWVPSSSIFCKRSQKKLVYFFALVLFYSSLSSLLRLILISYITNLTP